MGVGAAAVAAVAVLGAALFSAFNNDDEEEEDWKRKYWCSRENHSTVSESIHLAVDPSETLWINHLEKLNKISEAGVKKEINLSNVFHMFSCVFIWNAIYKIFIFFIQKYKIICKQDNL